MSCDLERIYSELATQLPQSLEQEEPFLLDESVIPVAPAEMSTDQPLIQRSYIQRLPGCRGDYLDLVAPRDFFRHLGLLALALLFHEQCDRTVVHVTNPESRVKHIVIEHRHWPKSTRSGFWTRPWVLGYVPDDAPPSFSNSLIGFEAPLLRLTNLADCQHNEQDWQNRDTLSGMGGTRATAEVAQFLLNAGRAGAKLGHFTIPANYPFFAAEVNLWTPEGWAHLRRTLTEINQRYASTDDKKSRAGSGPD